jgi:hypothetical protein
MALAEKKIRILLGFWGGVMGTEQGDGIWLRAKGTVAESGKLAGIFL